MTNQSDEKTALEWLAARHPDSPKKRLKEWFAHGRVQLDGEVIRKPHLRMEDPGERLGLGDSKPTVFFKSMPTRIHAQVNLLYIDNSLAIVNKGPGLLSVPLPDSNQNSALQVLDTYLQGKGAAELDRNRVNRRALKPLPVHRLDQYTSGLLCFAMNPKAREHLVKQVRDHSFLREYMALGDGKLDKLKGQWRSWFVLDEAGMEQHTYDHQVDGATEAISSYQVVEEITWPTGKHGDTHTVSKLRLRLKTGLKHQLRIHAAEAGVPLLGDRLYHPDYKSATNEKKGLPYDCKRQALHASSLGFVHPETGKLRRFNSKFPRDLIAVEDILRAKVQRSAKRKR
ncbi:RluA family pseudouridine synthase [Coraliomargarita parva]|uniref:RluA family pseudouridine synthase n=1 Tax=Coraliomargarita parva TaxID=3014050 RepID=UPI0022B58FB3|nr:RluA family pseudouridine synthase [Coraliomargarita parva]